MAIKLKKSDEHFKVLLQAIIEDVVTTQRQETAGITRSQKESTKIYCKTYGHA
ncbi:hypothetical protein FY034_17495 (plasmid) [Trichlorobacter lovleyi]|uniref:hypothetical protein n=1 Tax=Trichlorobacter lovleyi TaxID=313985 RepID=UPI002240346D|nr:hypothetical protein [Trichlorobacter lovleyi]QOX80818.1 hypothetical protein FY034_17495 [Trichlorobacter lovleyi]